MHTCTGLECLTNRNSVKNRVNSSWDWHDNMTQEQLRERAARKLELNKQQHNNLAAMDY